MVTHFFMVYQTTRKGAELCRSYNYAREETRSYHTRVAAITLAPIPRRPTYTLLLFT